MTPLRDPGPASAMARTHDSIPQLRGHLERCWHRDCDIDPMILRMRWLRRLGDLPQADCLEQEMEPLF